MTKVSTEMLWSGMNEEIPPPLPPTPEQPPPLGFSASLGSGSDFRTDLRPNAPGPPSVPGAQVSTVPSGRSATSVARDRIVVIGRRRAGKTIFLARLYEALWQGCTLVDGCLPSKTDRRAGVETKMSCRATSGAAHTQFMRIAEELRAGRWPAATIGNSYAELRVDYGGREYLLTALDYPGEVFRKAFMGDSTDPDAMELINAVDRAAAAIFLIDPAVVAAGGDEAHEDTFGLTQAATRIREGPGGSEVPIAVVFTKCDLNGAFLREAGGVREFAVRHFGQLFKSVEKTSVFASAAVRSVQNSLGKSVPRVDRVPDNVVEPLRYCFDGMAAASDRVRVAEVKRMRQETLKQAAAAEIAEQRRSTTAWVVFTVAIAALFVVAVVGALVYLEQRG